MATPQTLASDTIDQLSNVTDWKGRGRPALRPRTALRVVVCQFPLKSGLTDCLRVQEPAIPRARLRIIPPLVITHRLIKEAILAANPARVCHVVPAPREICRENE